MPIPYRSLLPAAGHSSSGFLRFADAVGELFNSILLLLQPSSMRSSSVARISPTPLSSVLEVGDDGGRHVLHSDIHCSRPPVFAVALLEIGRTNTEVTDRNLDLQIVPVGVPTEPDFVSELVIRLSSDVPVKKMSHEVVEAEADMPSEFPSLEDLAKRLQSVETEDLRGHKSFCRSKVR